ncbi:MAG: hypothetical protein ACRCW2_17005 [Cellulosilyticaceae bacterium]
METLRINKLKYEVILDEAGKIKQISDKRNVQANWVAQGEGYQFARPFINGTQEGEQEIKCKVMDYCEEGVKLQSDSGATQLAYRFEEESIWIDLEIPVGLGPRAGLQMDFNLLDLPQNGSWEHQGMPTVIYTDEEQEYGYFIFETSDKRYLALCVHKPFAAWRIKYSYEGHRMTGFQILAEATDVYTGSERPLRRVKTLQLQLIFKESIKDCLEAMSGALNIPMAYYELSGGALGSQIPIEIFGQADTILVKSPSGKEVEQQGDFVLKLEEAGIYEVIAKTNDRKTHVSRLLGCETWEKTFDKVNAFYKAHFQQPEGAFARVIWQDSLSPKAGITFEGVRFGDPHSLMSCRTGEFGGFCAWAMIKNCLMFEKKEELLESIHRYIYHWALNKGHEEQPFPGTVYKYPQIFQEREYGPYHLYHEINYPQHEVFLLEQLVDCYELGEDVLEDIILLGEHFVKEHMQDGVVICQNHKNGEAVDYCTVHAPIVALIKVMKVLRAVGSEKHTLFYQAAHQLAEHLYQRGGSFPTEGEPCTEDGSMACSAISLLWAYREIEAKPEYLELAKQLIQQHEMLVMKGMDCRMSQSSIRFWETQYESRDWGPSINAGHGWTMWIVEAKGLLAELTGDIEVLKEAYAGTLTNLARIDERGGMPCSYTPDMIPGTPHGSALLEAEVIRTGNFNDLRPTTSVMGMRYPVHTYSASGNYSLIKSAELWNHLSGVCLEKGIAVNGNLDNGIFKSAAAQWDTLILDKVPEQELLLDCTDVKALTIRWKEAYNQAIQIEGAEISAQTQTIIRLKPTGNVIKLKR